MVHSEMDKFIIDIVKKAGTSVGKKFGKIGIKYSKEHINDVVTDADLHANKIIIDAIKRKYPEHSIISEETGEDIKKSQYCWIIDPLDGTLNFASGVPLFGTMIGLAHKGKVMLGAIYFPLTKELLFAKNGQGAYLNGKRITCSVQKKWEESYGILNSLLSKNETYASKLFKHNTEKHCYVGSYGSAAINALYVSTGRRDWVYFNNSKIWDKVAPSIIFKEAGCKVSTIDGAPWNVKDGDMLVSNKYLHSKFLSVIQGK